MKLASRNQSKASVLNEGEREVVLMEAGDRDLSAREIRTQCEARVAKLVAEACRWRSAGHGRDWMPGDYRILIFETTVALNAELYVQFWSEPREPVLWEVSSGHLNRGARRFIREETKKKIGALGFEIGGNAKNFRKEVTIGNTGDVRAVARETVKIFCEALGYRGRTPLVARVIKDTRAERGVVHRSLTPEDVQKIFWNHGYGAEKADGFETPVLHIEREGVAYEAVLYGGIEGQNLYQCVDLRVLLGEGAGAHLAAVNAINATHRDVKAFLDEDGRAWLVQSISTSGGITEDGFASACRQFEYVMGHRQAVRLARRLRREASVPRPDSAGRKRETSRSEVIH
jgi:Putative bacterial sensory transduction regulator